jgi:hypothetical protein
VGTIQSYSDFTTPSAGNYRLDRVPYKAGPLGMEAARQAGRNRRCYSPTSHRLRCRYVWYEFDFLNYQRHRSSLLLWLVPFFGGKNGPSGEGRRSVELDPALAPKRMRFQTVGTLCKDDWSVDALKRQQKEKEFGSWQDLSDGGRRYWYDVLAVRVGGRDTSRKCQPMKSR